MKSLLFLIPLLINTQSNINSLNTEIYNYNSISKKVSQITNNEIKFFNLNENLLNNSRYIYSVKDELKIPERQIKAPSGYGFDKNGLLAEKHSDLYYSDTYTEPGGYVIMTTTAYQYTVYDNHPVYFVENNTSINKMFWFQKTDNIIIRFGYNATHYSYENSWGLITETIKSNPSWVSKANLDQDYSKGTGVIYSFNYRSGLGPGNSDTSLQTDIYCNYYFVATDTTSVQSVYVHNQSLLSPSLSFTFGVVGISLDLSFLEAAVYYSTPITLPSSII